MGYKPSSLIKDPCINGLDVLVEKIAIIIGMGLGVMNILEQFIRWGKGRQTFSFIQIKKVAAISTLTSMKPLSQVLYHPTYCDKSNENKSSMSSGPGNIV